MKIAKIIARKIGTSYRYFAIMQDGSEVTLRQTATRLYAFAFHFPCAKAGPGKGLAAEFVYGEKAPSHLASIYTTYPVTLAE